MAERENLQNKVTIDAIYQTGVSFYDFVWNYLQRVVLVGEALAVEAAKFYTGVVAGVGGIAIGAAEDKADRSNGAARSSAASCLMSSRVAGLR